MLRPANDTDVPAADRVAIPAERQETLRVLLRAVEASQAEAWRSIAAHATQVDRQIVAPQLAVLMRHLQDLARDLGVGGQARFDPATMSFEKPK